MIDQKLHRCYLIQDLMISNKKNMRNFFLGNIEMHNKPGEWYPEHILSWYKHYDDTNTVYFIYYEDLLKVS